jgi:hypothetical protein
MMKTNLKLCLTTGLLVWAAGSSADVVELKNGKTLTGKYVGGTAGTLRIETAEGVQVLETSQVLALTFTGVPAPAAVVAPPATTPAAAPASSTPAPTGGAVSVPAGTALLVRLVDPVSSKDPQGKRFTTTLEVDLAVNGVVVARAGTKI